jgi:hypothetical protein
MNTNDFNLLTVLKLEKDRLEICENNKERPQYKIIIEWMDHRIRELEHHDRNALC